MRHLRRRSCSIHLPTSQISQVVTEIPVEDAGRAGPRDLLLVLSFAAGNWRLTGLTLGWTFLLPVLGLGGLLFLLLLLDINTQRQKISVRKLSNTDCFMGPHPEGRLCFPGHKIRLIYFVQQNQVTADFVEAGISLVGPARTYKAPSHRTAVTRRCFGYQSASKAANGFHR